MTYTASATVSAGASGVLVNTATVTAPGGVTDANPGNNTATDSNVLSPEADLAVSKSDDQDSVAPGETITYSITVNNGGPSNAIGATVSDVFPAEFTGVSWTCVGAGGGSCTAAGSGHINDTVDLPGGASVTYSATGTVSAGAIGTLDNTATATAPGGVLDPNSSNNSATDSDHVEDPVFADGFESGNTSAWSVTVGAVVVKRWSEPVRELQVVFYLNERAIRTIYRDGLPLVVATACDGAEIASVEMRSGGQLSFRLVARTDSGETVLSDWRMVDTKAPTLRFELRLATGESYDDGELYLLHGGNPLLWLTHLDNETLPVCQVLTGAAEGIRQVR